MSNFDRSQRLRDPASLSFPLRIGRDGPRNSRRAGHVREQIEQVLFTSPGERVFRPGFGAGVKALVFEPNRAELREVARRRILSSLAEALRGDVDPQSLDVDVSGEDERIEIVVRYRLVALGVTSTERFTLGVRAHG